MSNRSDLPLPRYRFTTDESETMFGVDFIHNLKEGYRTFLPPKHTRAEAKALAKKHLEELNQGAKP